VYWCNSYTIVHFSLDIIKWFKCKLIFFYIVLDTDSPPSQYQHLGTPENPKNVNLDKTIPKEDMKSYLKIFKEYQEVFSWPYQEFKTYDTHIIQHTISLKSGVKPFQKNLRKYHPSLEPLMYQEMKKLLDAKIIFQVRHSAWVVNMVHVRRSLGRFSCVWIS
jgi:hypothetical protein